MCYIYVCVCVHSMVYFLVLVQKNYNDRSDASITDMMVEESSVVCGLILVSFN